MTVRLASISDFYAAFPNVRFMYGSEQFIRLNAPRAEAVRCFIGYADNEAPVLGLIMGYRDGTWLAPFSAPFCEIAYNKPHSLETIYDFLTELTDLLQPASVKITLAPYFYDPAMLTKLHGVGANIATKATFDYNYHYPLEQFPDFEKYLDRAAAKNFRRAKEAGFVFEKTDDIDRAYAVIKANRDSHGYPLAMSLQQVKDTVAPAGPAIADFFILSLDGTDVAAAMVYRVAEGIAQVIYWGDAPGYSAQRPMNLLPYHIFAFYHDLGFKIVDIGPSSTAGIPASGLCRFKESIGCRLSLKPTFTL